MPSNEYHFITHWRFRSTCEEIYEILGDAEDLARWWPAVYLDVKQVEPTDDRGLGGKVSLYTKGWLPYTLCWTFRTTEVRPPHGYTIEADGDFVGRGVWTFVQDGDDVDVTYDWRLRADKSLLRQWSFLLKPLFGANHRWAMAQGRQSLELELARRRARTPEARASIPPPPGPASQTPLLVGTLVAAAGAYLGYRLGSR